MASARDRVLAEALALPEPERASLASDLLASLDGEMDDALEVERTWAREIEQRARDVRDGRVALIDHDDLMAELRAIELEDE